MKKLINKVNLYSTLILISGIFGSALAAPSGHLTAQDIAASVGYTNATLVREIQNYRIDGFNAIGHKRLILRTGARERYLVTFDRYCDELRSANRIGTTSTASRLTTFDNVIVLRSFRGKEVCPINTIYKLEGTQEKPS